MWIHRYIYPRIVAAGWKSLFPQAYRNLLRTLTLQLLDFLSVMAMPSALNLSTTAMTLIYDVASKTLEIHTSRLTPIPNDDTEDHLIQVKTAALCARELTWPAFFPDFFYSEYSHQRNHTRIRPCRDSHDCST